MVSTRKRKAPNGWHQPWAVGYVSAPTAVGAGMWDYWLADVEAYAMEHHLRLLRTFTHKEPRSGAGGGLAELVQFLRERAHQRVGHAGVVIVPTVDHLSSARDGSADAVQQLLRLHFGVDIRAAQIAETRRMHPGAPQSSADTGTWQASFASVLFGLDGPRWLGGPR